MTQKAKTEKAITEKTMTDEIKNGKGLEEVRRLLRGRMAPVRDQELRRDLWPLMLQRMERGAGPWFLRVAWFDWALLGVAGGVVAFFPMLIPALLYHL